MSVFRDVAVRERVREHVQGAVAGVVEGGLWDGFTHSTQLRRLFLPMEVQRRPAPAVRRRRRHGALLFQVRLRVQGRKRRLPPARPRRHGRRHRRRRRHVHR